MRLYQQLIISVIAVIAFSWFLVIEPNIKRK